MTLRELGPVVFMGDYINLRDEDTNEQIVDAPFRFIECINDKLSDVLGREVTGICASRDRDEHGDEIGSAYLTVWVKAKE